VVLVDDEGAIRRALRRILERRDWHVEEAADGVEALDLIRASAGDPFDVVLCDLKMPVMTGMQLVDQLASENPEQRSRFVIITGDNVAAGPADFVARMDLPVVDKPFRIDELLATLDAVLERTHV
jgi:CheY-like chemotaxis protein